MKWDVWLKTIIQEIAGNYAISEEKSKKFFRDLIQLLK